jgi:hypothetical protein
MTMSNSERSSEHPVRRIAIRTLPSVERRAVNAIGVSA